MLQKKILSTLITTVQMPSVAAYDTHREMHTSTVNKDISIAREFKKQISDPSRKHGVIYQVKERKRTSKLK